MNRRELLAGATTLVIAGCGGPQTAGQAAQSSAPIVPTGDPFAGAKLMADVREYVGFGTHRTGSPGDIATSDWFARRWKTIGYEIEQTEFPTPNADTRVAKLRFGTEAVDGFAQPPLSFTPEGGINAPMVYFNPKSAKDVANRIAIVHIPRQPGAPTQPDLRPVIERAGLAGALGIVAISSSPSGEPVAINTPSEMEFPTPVLIVPAKHKTAIDAAVSAGEPAKLVIEGTGGFRNGKNTIARRGTAGPWVIISTPQSGWFTCGGERGPGIAMSLALSEWAVQKNFPVRFLFIATSGHEWADAGAHIFHQMQAPKPAETMLWWHLGASFGARGYQETANGLTPLDTPNTARTLMLTEDLMASAQAAFAGQPVIEQPLKRDPATALGEYKLVAAEGYPSSAGFWGANPLFHTPIDGADSTTGAIMEPIARAVAKVIEERIARG
jgi:hypothetical protein